MIWISQGGGPWGGGPRGGGPWGGGSRNTGGGPGSGPRNRGPYPPDFEEWLRRGQDRVRRILPGGFGTGAGIAVVLIAIVAIWLASGFYRVQPDEVGIVLRFGAYNRMTQPGLNYHLPSPIETALTPSVTRVNRTEIGYRSGETLTTREPVSRQVPEEALMLTGDENIVDVNFTVFWVIKDAKAYLFNIRDPELTVKSAAESAMREVVGETPIAQALAEGRAKIEAETRELLQAILDSYAAGIEITQLQLQRVDPPAEVIDAFRDVQAALADRARLRNEAEAYRNSIIPIARGDAVRIEQEAEAYRLATVARAQGDAARFLSVYNAFKATQDVTTQRLYLETMEEILKNSNKVIIDKSAQGGNGVLPYLPLPALGGGEKASTPAAGTSPAPAAPGAAATPPPQSSAQSPDNLVSAPAPSSGQD
ncbi:MAG: FtsH protease activity modulator HflK [Alphaproteobacteria bacterium]|nr:FtsH protease activity modulator HflK [Alphaproteobacteria bacterium]